MCKQYRLNGYPGLVQQAKNRQTGTTISVYHSEQAGYDPEGTPWTLVCEDHNELCGMTTLVLARYHASVPEWCEACNSAINTSEDE